MNSLDDPAGVTAPFWVCFLIQEMGKESSMTPDGLPADYVCVSLKLLGGLRLWPREGYPGSLLPEDPFLLLDPETLLCRAEHCPLPSLPAPLCPSSLLSQSLIFVSMSLWKLLCWIRAVAAVNVNVDTAVPSEALILVRAGLQPQLSLGGGAHAGDWRSRRKGGLCRRTGQAAGNLPRRDLDLEGRARERHVHKGETACPPVQSAEA